ncbi:NADPH-dependent FMN reductase [Methanococcus maripaludis C5]|uniref:NADPH-dependent FMN reductase n=1 Tax=Methanococcus maripaludis (strain C5 / ATCC BAA-1333) TaxID=402880 RepID=A4FZ08_METM5|nr:flavodoxin family protein [Methanococcus maripaludis]ABO35442.1 NADPH-dependent FMN reductase [Methanococcus maripaludis C5]
MKVIAFNGSPRRNGNTSILLNKVLEELNKEGIKTEQIHIAGENLRGCIACNKCFENKDKKCIIQTDSLNEYIKKIIDADGIILGSPTYFTDITAEMKAFIDRLGYVSLANDVLLKRKVGASVVAVRRAGSIHAFNTMNNLFTINQMIIPGSSYWNMGIGNSIGEVSDDEEGMKTMETLGKNIAWLLKKINK